MSRPDEVPKWARCEHQGGSLVDRRWTDADGWLHTVTVDWCGVQPMISLRAEWRNSGELRLVALKGVDDE